VIYRCNQNKECGQDQLFGLIQKHRGRPLRKKFRQDGFEILPRVRIKYITARLSDNRTSARLPGVRAKGSRLQILSPSPLADDPIITPAAVKVASISCPGILRGDERVCEARTHLILSGFFWFSQAKQMVAIRIE
jgi:hypothetical protein